MPAPVPTSLRLAFSVALSKLDDKTAGRIGPMGHCIRHAEKRGAGDGTRRTSWSVARGKR